MSWSIPVTDEIDGVNVINAESHADHRGRLVQVLPGIRLVGSVRTGEPLAFGSARPPWPSLPSATDRLVVPGIRLGAGRSRGRAKEGRTPVQMIELRSDEPTVLQILPASPTASALSDIDLIYLVSEEYDGTDEFGIAWNDPSLAIPWGSIGRSSRRVIVTIRSSSGNGSRSSRDGGWRPGWPGSSKRASFRSIPPT